MEYLSNAVGGLLAQDESHFDDTTPRLEPSHPQFVNGNAVWPEGVPDHVKNVLNAYTKVCEKHDSTVETIDQWYFEACKLQEIAAHQLAWNISAKKKHQRRLLRNLANTSLGNQSKLIEFHKVGLDKKSATKKSRNTSQTRLSRSKMTRRDSLAI